MPTEVPLAGPKAGYQADTGGLEIKGITYQWGAEQAGVPIGFVIHHRRMRGL